MPGDRLGASGRELGTLFRLGTVGDWPDGRLLEHFVGHRDDGGEAAFEALVRRHGPMVWRVCRGVLGDAHAAEDAFQATFLVLAEKAGAIHRRDSVAAWLYGVARRISRRARADAARRRLLERQAARPAADDPGPSGPFEDEALLREVDRLPTHYRGPIVLHDLGGCSYEEVARRLNCPVGTVKARLHRGRALLRSRLTARGHAPTASPAPAAVSLALAERTVRSAVSLAMGRAATGAVPPAVAASARWVLNAMFLAQLRTAAALVVVLGLVATGAAAVVASQESGPPDSEGPPPQVVAPNPPSLRQAPTPTPEQIDHRALEIATALDDPPQRAEVLLHLGRALLRRGRTDAALETFRLARQAAEQVPPDGSNAVIHPATRIGEALAEAGDLDAARDTLRKAIAIVQRKDDSHHQANEWSRLKETWLRWFGREGIQAVLDPYRDHLARQERFGDAPAYLVALDAAAGDFDEALRTVREWEVSQDPRGVWPRSEKALGWLRSEALVRIASELRPEDRDVADRVLAEAKRGIQAEPHGLSRASRLLDLAQTEARLGRFEDARATIEAVDPDADPTSDDYIRYMKGNTLLTLAEERLATDDPHGARESVADALRVGETIEEPDHIPQPLKRAAELSLKLGDIETAEAIVAEITGRGWSEPDRWREQVAKARRESGDEVAARAELQRALEDAEARLRDLLAQPPEPDRVPFPEYAPYVAEADRVAWAAAEVARLRLKLGDVEAARRTIDELPDDARPEAIPALAWVLGGLGELDAAWSLIEGSDSPRRREQAIVRVAIGLPASSVAETNPEAGRSR